MRLANKIAIITGAGAGIGEATALRFAEEGAKLVLVDIGEAILNNAAAKVAAAGGDCIAVVADISKEEDARRISEKAVERFGGIDILVNNAADFTTFSVEDAEVAHWQKVLSVNVIGTALVAKFAIPHMKKRGKGSIVNLSSMSGIIAQPNFATYNSTEREWIRMGLTKEEWMGKMAPMHMLNRVGDASEVANAILFLASDEASFITAAHLLVDGGYIAR
jgi:NAD(P)-dependent dehydrogenase (short-subunit alcohol dehydrogenase family)